MLLLIVGFILACAAIAFGPRRISLWMALALAWLAGSAIAFLALTVAQSYLRFPAEAFQNLFVSASVGFAIYLGWRVSKARKPTIRERSA